MEWTMGLAQGGRRVVPLLWAALGLASSVAAGCDRPPAPSARPAASRPGTSPDGRTAPAHEERLVYEQGKGDARDLFVVPAPGGTPRRLTSDPAPDGLPRWSANGRSILFTSNRTGSWQIFRIPATGGEARRVRANGHREWQADESPDGRTLALLSNAEGPECLWLMDLASGHARALVRHGRRSILGNPHWSPDGTRIVFSSNWREGHQIYVVDVGSGEERRISTKGGCEPRFSPDGAKVVYVGRRPRKDRSEIVEHDLATGEEEVLVKWPALNYDPVYSPDGTEIAFASTITGGWEVYRQRLSDGEAFRVTFAGEDARYPDYRPAPRAATRGR
jgi:TolB protein